MGKKRSLKKLNSIHIATFAPWKNGVREPTNGMIEPMLSFFQERVKILILLEQPYPGSDRLIPFIHKYKKGKKIGKIKNCIVSMLLYPFLKLENSPGTKITFKLRDFVSVLETGLTNKKVDLFIGMESINTIAGIFLRKLGKVRLVAYYVSDYSPNRYPSGFLNSIYLKLDQFCAKHADYIWDVSLAMQPARIQQGLKSGECAPVIHVPNGLFKEQINHLPFAKRQKHTSVFVGTLGLANGPDLAIKAFSIVCKKFKDAKLHIIGGRGAGYEEKHLSKLVSKYKLNTNVEFHGFKSNLQELTNIVKHFQIALAPYKNISGSIRLYGDATKIRLYLAAGLPVITTSVPPLGKEVYEKGAAIIAKDDSEDLAKKIINLFENPKLRRELTKNAIKFSKNNTWDKTYSNALKKMSLRTS